jgi:hypothetical protein
MSLLKVQEKGLIIPNLYVCKFSMFKYFTYDTESFKVIEYSVKL